MKNPFRISLATGLLAAVALVGVGCSAQPDTTSYTTTTTSTTVPGPAPASIAVVPPAVVPPPAVAAVPPPPLAAAPGEVTRQTSTTTYAYPDANSAAADQLGPTTVTRESVTTYPSPTENYPGTVTVQPNAEWAPSVQTGPAPLPPNAAPVASESTTTRYSAPGVVTSETVSNGPLGTTTTRSNSYSETEDY